MTSPDRRVALVTGGAGGVGRGVVTALAAAGWTVWFTGRGGTSPEDRLGRLATRIAAHGGDARPVSCDHTDDDAVAALFDRIAAESGGLDLLVNAVWAAPEGFAGFTAPFWERPVSDWDPLVGVGLRAHYVATVHAARIMVPAGRGLVVHISSFGSRGHLHSVAYGVSKTGLDKMAADMAVELSGTGVSVVSLWLGLIRTRMLVASGLTEFAGFSIDRAEDPGFVGRVVDALARDPEIGKRSGATLVSAEIGAALGITNDDGTVPDSHRAAFGGGGLFGPGGTVTTVG
ncbi:SDR family NAD(P)-dependent oxidoreductase [Williamsia deligens]|uniref:SDR family NAD(P)-dependent oxidoreductase n=1 Tax=Williamsia deligens TaxID=321325 RepID=A0ABW3GBE9_9NOCA|nr:SDR family NAD(P)-dependent oxidoreductase [Williamsia deligens]MCP2193110.1 NAD(P)-dependent dehydrogenase, short-chain alcohol dehydrogenase family [Williamsia deligens]